MSIKTKNIDKYPYTGIRKVNGEIKLRDADVLANCGLSLEDMPNLTAGKVYTAVCVEGFGDCEDITIIDDIGEEQTLGDFFFEEVDDD